MKRYDNVQDYLAAHGYTWNPDTKNYEKPSYLGDTQKIPWEETKGHTADSFPAKARARKWVPENGEIAAPEQETPPPSSWGYSMWGNIVEYSPEDGIRINPKLFSDEGVGARSTEHWQAVLQVQDVDLQAVGSNFVHNLSPEALQDGHLHIKQYVTSDREWSRAHSVRIMVHRDGLLVKEGRVKFPHAPICGDTVRLDMELAKPLSRGRGRWTDETINNQLYRLYGRAVVDHIPYRDRVVDGSKAYVRISPNKPDIRHQGDAFTYAMQVLDEFKRESAYPRNQELTSRQVGLVWEDCGIRDADSQYVRIRGESPQFVVKKVGTYGVSRLDSDGREVAIALVPFVEKDGKLTNAKEITFPTVGGGLGPVRGLFINGTYVPFPTEPQAEVVKDTLLQKPWTEEELMPIEEARKLSKFPEV